MGRGEERERKREKGGGEERGEWEGRREWVRYLMVNHSFFLELVDDFGCLFVTLYLWVSPQQIITHSPLTERQCQWSFPSSCKHT